MPNGEERPIAFASRTLQPSERNYAQLKFHQYLFGRKFTLITDHKPLLAVLGQKKGIPSLAAARLQRWAVLLSAYNYQLEFKPTGLHCNADGLSRLPLQSTSRLGDVPEATAYNIRQLAALPLTSEAIKKATRTDIVLSKVLQYTKHGWPEQVAEAMQPYATRKSEITVEDECLLWGIRVIIPKRLQPEVLRELHRDHPGIIKDEGSGKVSSMVATPRQGDRRYCQELPIMSSRQTRTTRRPITSLVLASKALAASPHRLCRPLSREVVSAHHGCTFQVARNF